MIKTVPVSSSLQPTNNLTNGGTTITSVITSPTQTVGTVTTTETFPVSSSTQPTNNLPSDGTTTTTGTVLVSSITQPTGTGGATTMIKTVPVSSTQPTNNLPSDGTTTTIGTFLISNITQPTKTEGATTVLQNVPVCSTLQPTKTVATTGTSQVSNSTQPTSNLASDGATTISVIIVVVVVTILVVIVVGVIILVVFFRAKKRKKGKLVINKLQNVTEGIEMKLKQEGIENENSSNADQPQYAEIQKKVPPNVPTKSEELVAYLNQNNPLTGGYSEIESEQADSNHALPAKPPIHINLLDPMSEETESNPMYQNMDQLPSTTNVPQEMDVYTVPDTTRSDTVETLYETVYSEPIQPSLFTDTDGTPSSDSDNLQPYNPIYTVPIDLPKSKVVLKVSASNIREVSELGVGVFGNVILAETVGLSAKDLRLSESDDDKSKSTLVAVKILKSDAPNATKEAFEKEVNFMSRLTDTNVIRILGVCHEDTPFIMMEYMEKGDLNQYLQKFRTLSTTDSEPQGQITINTLVHMATQIASAMKYLASHNYVHRDLATRNCLVGQNYLVKISDFGMSRSLYDSHYYRIHGRFVLPVRWMAYECFYGKFSQKSDVWAFGVTMWEIFTLAKEQPYNDMSDKQVVENALKGKNLKTLPRPDMCPLKVYKIMLECWEHNSDQRATFEELFRLLASIHI